MGALCCMSRLQLGVMGPGSSRAHSSSTAPGLQAALEVEQPLVHSSQGFTANGMAHSHAAVHGHGTTHLGGMPLRGRLKEAARSFVAATFHKNTAVMCVAGMTCNILTSLAWWVNGLSQQPATTACCYL